MAAVRLGAGWLALSTNSVAWGRETSSLSSEKGCAELSSVTASGRVDAPFNGKEMMLVRTMVTFAHAAREATMVTGCPVTDRNPIPSSLVSRLVCV